MEDKRYAVLIDSDNVSAKYITAILDEMTKYGVITYKRIYGDWTNNQASKWREELLTNSITPIQQFCNTAGKNATDSALIIDAMDILYTGRVDGFCIVSSDSDFTKLASRLRESGMEVIGMGENKTPKSFKAACSVFTSLEILLEQDTDKAKENISQKTIEEAIVEIITENENNGRKTGLGELGSSLLKKYSDFDVRNYGYSSLSKFIEEMEDTFILYKKENTILVKLRDDNLKREQLEAYIRECVGKSNGEGVDLAAMGQKLHKKYPDFKVKEYGYSTLQKFVSHISGLELITESETVKRLVEKKESDAEPMIAQSQKTTVKKRKKLKS
ncbi:MAG: NYN domain-containing protein [Lachnospiraceae bacterium]